MKVFAILLVALILPSIAAFDADTFDYAHADYADPDIDWNTLDYAQIPAERYRELPYEKLNYAAPGFRYDLIDPALLTRKGLRKYMADVGCSGCRFFPQYMNYRAMKFRSDGFSHMGYNINFAAYPPGTIFAIDELGRIKARVAERAVVSPRGDERVTVQAKRPARITGHQGQSTLTGAAEVQQGGLRMLHPQSQLTAVSKEHFTTRNRPLAISDEATWQQLFHVQQEINAAYRNSPAWDEAKRQLVQLRDRLKADLGITGEITLRQIEGRLQDYASPGTTAALQGQTSSLTVHQVTFNTRGGGVLAAEYGGAVRAAVNGNMGVRNGNARLHYDNGRLTTPITGMGSPAVPAAYVFGATMVQQRGVTTLSRNNQELVRIDQDPHYIERRYGLQPERAVELAGILQELDGLELSISGRRSMVRQRELRQAYLAGTNPYPAATPSPSAPHVSGRAVDIRNFRVLSQEHRQRVIAAFRKRGWTWGGDNSGRQYDPVHFQKMD